MGYIIKAECSSCGYESKGLTIGNGRNLIAACNSCNSIVNPERNLFRFEVPTCPTCNAPLPRDGFIDAGCLYSDPTGEIPTEHSCPNCDGGHLAFQEIMHFYSEIQDCCPNVDQVIHGRYSGDNLSVPGMWLQNGKCIIENPPEPKVDQPMELLVTSVQRDDDQVSEVRMRFIRFIDDLHPRC